MGKSAKRKSAKLRSAVRVNGSRAQVMNGTALKTPGNLRKKDLKYNKQGRIVSRKKSARAKKENRLVKSGYVTEKGKFGSKFVGEQKRSAKKSPKRRSKKGSRSSNSRRTSSSSWF
jgi:hypothetical protein